MQDLLDRKKYFLNNNKSYIIQKYFHFLPLFIISVAIKASPSNKPVIGEIKALKILEDT